MIQVYYSLQEFKRANAGTQMSCAIGMFDGVHVGHQLVIESALRQAKQKNIKSCVLTFSNHPQQVLTQTATPLLSCLSERLNYFENLGVECALVLTFDEALMQLSAMQFIETVLLETLNVKFVSVGYDHRFGKNRQGDGTLLKASGTEHGFDVDIVEPVKVGNQIVSSTLIRKLLTYGEPEQATPLLGRNYSIVGEVVSGDHRGHTIGFPTANLKVPEGRLIPAKGVYAGLAIMDGQTYKAVCNIGVHPTFNEADSAKVEVHILGFQGDIYGKILTFEFVKFLRSEQKFPTVDALIQQIKNDCSQAENELVIS